MNITRAHPSEADVLTEIAMAAKRHWGYPEAWMRKWEPILTVTAAMISRHEFFDGRVGERIVGFAALKREENVLLLCDLWVLPSEMGQGIGRRLFRRAQQRARELGFANFEIESDPYAAGFYERMGAVLVGSHTTLIEGQARELPVYRCGTFMNVEHGRLDSEHPGVEAREAK